MEREIAKISELRSGKFFPQGSRLRTRLNSDLRIDASNLRYCFEIT